MYQHQPVLAQEVYENLPDKLNIYFDGTFGHGGHAIYILSQLQNHDPDKYKSAKVIGVDRDEEMLNNAEEFINKYKNKIFLAKASYEDIGQILSSQGHSQADFILLDLGVNLKHFKDSTRGFSIKKDASLDMRYDQNQKFTAQELINTYSYEDIVNMLKRYGDFGDKFASYIAQRIIDARKDNPIKTTMQLREVIKSGGIGEKKLAILFQCIRIQVNDELGHLERFLEKFPKYISKNGICQIITYHSIEDRIVKLAFKELATTSKFVLINKHVIKPTYTEVQRNKAARSAKLRIIQAL